MGERLERWVLGSREEAVRDLSSKMGPQPADAKLQKELWVWLTESGVRSQAQIPLAGDLSPRRYFRVLLRPTGSAIAVFYPPDLAAVEQRFAAVQRLLLSAGVRVPEILLRNPERGWVLLEDLGEATLYDRRHEGWAFLTPQLAQAVNVAERIAALDPIEVRQLGSPDLGSELLRRELAQTEQCLFERCELYQDRGFAREMGQALDELASRLGELPLQPCHRDLMARNLIPQGDGPIGVLDFQDLRFGPPGYDLASLFHDSLFASETLEQELAAYAPRARSRQEEDRHRVTAQRCLKAAGTFAAFALRGAKRHLPLLAPTLEHAWKALGELPEGRSVVAHIGLRWRSALARGGFC